MRVACNLRPVPSSMYHPCIALVWVEIDLVVGFICLFLRRRPKCGIPVRFDAGDARHSLSGSVFGSIREAPKEFKSCNASVYLVSASASACAVILMTVKTVCSPTPVLRDEVALLFCGVVGWRSLRAGWGLGGEGGGAWGHAGDESRVRAPTPPNK